MANDLATIIDAEGIGIHAAREIDLSESPIVQEKAVLCATGISENAHNLTTVINSCGRGEDGVREIDLGRRRHRPGEIRAVRHLH